MHPFTLLLVLLLTSACGGLPVVNEPIAGRDDSVVAPVLRAEYELVNVRGLPDGESLYLAGSVSTVDGEFADHTPRTSFGGQVLTGDLAVDFTMTEVVILFGIEQRFGGAFSGDVFSGVGHNDLSVEAGWSGGRAKEVRNGFGWLLGAQVDAEIQEWMVAYLRAELLLLPASAHTTKLELGLDFRLTEQLGLLIGYRAWNYEQDHGTELDIDMRGLLVGMNLRW